MKSILVTLPVSKTSGWSKMLALLNVLRMLTTIPVSSVSGWLKATANSNIDVVSRTRVVSQASNGWLKALVS